MACLSTAMITNMPFQYLHNSIIYSFGVSTAMIMNMDPHDSTLLAWCKQCNDNEQANSRKT